MIDCPYSCADCPTNRKLCVEEWALCKKYKELVTVDVETGRGLPPLPVCPSPVQLNGLITTIVNL